MTARTKRPDEQKEQEPQQTWHGWVIPKKAWWRGCGAAADLLSVWAIHADLEQQTGDAGGESAGNMERVGRSTVGKQVHGEHQHGDELLAPRARKTSGG